MKVLLLGHNGYLGSSLYSNLDVDILHNKNIYNDGNDYEYVINCIGKPDLEYCENNTETTNYSNAYVINDIIKYYPNSKIINFSSYYVYDDIGFCDENSNVTKKYAYCRQKLESESLNKNGVTFRVGKLFGHKDLDKQNKLTEFIIKNDELRLDTVEFNPTDVTQILNIVKHELFYKNLNGVYNLSNDGYTNHLDYGKLINDLMGSNKIIIKSDNNVRKFDNYGKFLMSCDKIKKYVKLEHWELALKKYIKKL
jgi:dTDP-4-dehydrorhamnose reductase